MSAPWIWSGWIRGGRQVPQQRIQHMYTNVTLLSQLTQTGCLRTLLHGCNTHLLLCELVSNEHTLYGIGVAVTDGVQLRGGGGTRNAQKPNERMLPDQSLVKYTAYIQSSLLWRGP